MRFVWHAVAGLGMLGAICNFHPLQPAFADEATAGKSSQVTLLDGTSVSGSLQAVSVDSIDVLTEEGLKKIPAGDVAQVELSPPAEPSGDAADASIEAVFADKSVLHLKSFESDGTSATASTESVTSLSVPVRQVSSLRFTELDEKIAAGWDDLLERNARDDLLIIRKGDVLDYVAGTIGRITPTAIVMLVRDRELSAPRDKVFGLIFASRSASATKPRLAVRTRSGDFIQAETVAMAEGGLQITSASIGKVTLPMEGISVLDFGGGRIRSLGDLPFDQSASKAPFENDSVVWFVSRNAPAGSGGKAPLTIGKKEFRRGLWLHSGAVVRFRLNREFTRLKATAGFDLTHVTRMPRFDPRVKLVILGDGKELFAKEFLWSDSPEPLDINLSDVRELTIRVDSAGTAQGILEHFALGDAQVIQ